MPNTEVKLNGAEDTRLVTIRENRKMPTLESSHPIGWLFFYAGQKQKPHSLSMKAVGQKYIARATEPNDEGA